MTTMETFEAGYALGKMMQITTNIEWVGIGIIISWVGMGIWSLVRYHIIEGQSEEY